MTDIDGKTLSPLPSQDLITLTHIVYALHAFSALVVSSFSWSLEVIILILEFHTVEVLGQT